MISLFLPSLTILLVLSLGACGFDRDAQDKKLTKGCQAAIKTTMNAQTTIESINKSTFGFVETLGNGKNYRSVKLDVTQKDDGWRQNDQQYECIFIESINMAGGGMKAEIYQLKHGETVYGRDDKGNVIGNLNDWLSLQDVVKQALY
ncbi:MAG: hypothetical protein LRZ85_04575 [Alphaproteobacteria bacterium]|nr:hypothetical protein [Alphaproteobacteria bacterium]